MLLIIFIFAFFTISISPKMFFTLHDEYSFGKVSKEILSGNIALALEKSITYPFLITLTFLIFGSSLSVFYSLNLFLGALSVLVIFLVTYLLFEREGAALYSALLLSFFPLHILVSGSMESNTSSIFFAMLALFCFLFYFKNRGFRSRMLAAVSLSLAVCSRLEFVVLILVFGIMVLLFDKDLRKGFRTLKYWSPWILSILLVTPFLISTAYYATLISEENPHAYGYYQHILSTAALGENIYFAERLFINPSFFPSYFILFFLIGAASLLIRERKKLFFLLLWILTFIVVYLSFEFPQERLLLIGYIMVIVLWAGGISFLEESAKKMVFKKPDPRISLGISIAILLLLSFAFYPYLALVQRSPTKVNTRLYLWEQREPYLEREAMLYMERNLGECVILVVDSEPFIAGHLRPFTIGYVLEDPGILNGLGDCVLFFEDMYCNASKAIYDDEAVDKEYKRLCREMHEKFELEIFKEFEIDLNENYSDLKSKVIEGDSFTFRLYKINSVKS